MAILIKFSGIKIKGFVYNPILGIEFQPYWFTFTGILIFIFGLRLLKRY